MPVDYSVFTHSVSKSAAQGVQGAWLARFGFVVFGIAVLGLAVRTAPYWRLWSRLAHVGFGISMIAVAVFSHAPWDGSPYDQTVDLFHSVASFGVGLSFIIGVVIVSLGRPRGAGQDGSSIGWRFRPGSSSPFSWPMSARPGWCSA